MRQLTVTAATIGFFALAFVGWLSGVPVWICAARAAAGAAGLYVLLRLAGGAAVKIIADAAARGPAPQRRTDKERL